jgi:SHS2 domain-containing protein
MTVPPAEGFAYYRHGPHEQHAGGIGLRAWGYDLPGCLRQALRGVFNLVVPLAQVRPDETRELQGQGDPVEALLVEWLNEALYLHDVEGFVLHDLDRPVQTGRRVHARLHGEPLDTARHPRGAVVRAVTREDLELAVGAAGVEARLKINT